MKRSLKGKVAAVLAGALLALVIGEAGARLLAPRLRNYDVEMWRYARLLKTTGRTSGIRFEHAPDSRAVLMGVEVRTNSDGLRDDEHLKKPAAAVRIAALGDSVTLGWGVEQERVYSEVLEGLLNEKSLLGEGRRAEVLNFAVGNYNTRDEKEMLFRRAFSYDPHAVVVGVFVNDAESWQQRRTPFLRRHSLLAVWLWGRADALMRRLGYRQSWEEYYLSLYRPDREGLRRMREAMGEVLAECRRRRIPVIVAMLPDLHRLDPYPFHEIHRLVASMASEGDAFFIDLLDALPAGDDERYWVSPSDPHPNAKAHAPLCGRPRRQCAVEGSA